MINVVKGQRLDLAKAGASDAINGKFRIGLGWDINQNSAGDFDLDAIAILTDDAGYVTGAFDVVFYNNLQHPSGAVVHTGDNRTGAGEGDDEVINIDLSKLPQHYTHIHFAVIIYEAEQRRQNFGMVNNAFIRMVDDSTGTELLRYDLTEDYSIEQSVLFAELYKKDGAWKFTAKGTGIEGDLTTVCSWFGA